MTKVKQAYDKYWEGRVNNFEDYPRNKALPGLFEKGQLVLDLGCGDGVVAQYLEKNIGVKVIGADFSQEALKIAQSKGVETKLINAEENLPFKDESFDVVFWGDNIEHLFNPMDVAKEIKRVLKKGGKLILSTPNSGYWRYRLYYLLKGSLADTEFNGLKRWDWTHIRLFNTKILKEFLKEAGFSNINKVIGVSNRRLDMHLLNIFPNLFGMILVVEVRKDE